MSESKWYVVHTYSGHESKVKANIQKIVENRGMEDVIVEIAIPTLEKTEIKDGKTKVKIEKVYPGYVVVKMVMTDESWYVVRNTRGVTGFVGPSSKPVPLTDAEVLSMGLEDPSAASNLSDVVIDVKVGEIVRVTAEQFKDFEGVITHIDEANKRLKLNIEMFGRATPVELNYNEIAKLS